MDLRNLRRARVIEMEFPSYSFNEVASSELNKRLYKNSRSERLLASALAIVYNEDDARSLADRLLKRFGSIDTLLMQDMARLRNVFNITPKAATLLTLLGAISSRRITDEFKIGTALDYTEIERCLVGIFLGVPIETVYAIFIGKNNCVVGIEYIGEGIINASTIYPRKIMELSLRIGAKGVIIAHNHPDGKATPSNEDIATTSKLAYVLNNSSITLLRHYVVSGRNIDSVNFSIM